MISGCGFHEEWRDCKPCRPTQCNEIGMKSLEMEECTNSCNKNTSGCYCQEGYLRHGNSRHCVRERHCRKHRPFQLMSTQSYD